MAGGGLGIAPAVPAFRRDQQGALRGADDGGGGGERAQEQTVCAMSQISFSTDEIVTPKKPTSVAEVAKQQELSGTLRSESEDKMKKQLSEAKCRELSGHDIFAPPREIHPQPLATQNSEMDKDIGESTPQSSHSSAKIGEVMHNFCTYVFIYRTSQISLIL